MKNFSGCPQPTERLSLIPVHRERERKRGKRRALSLYNYTREFL